MAECLPGVQTIMANWAPCLLKIVIQPVDISANFALALEEDIIQVELGYGHGGVLTSSGRVFTWGANGYGQLAPLITENQLT